MPQPMVEQPKVPQPPPPQQIPRPEPPPQPEERMLTGVSNGAQVIQSTPLPDGFVPPVASLSPLKVPASDLSYSRAQRRGERLAMQMRRDGSLKAKSPRKVILPQPEEASVVETMGQLINSVKTRQDARAQPQPEEAD